MLGGMPTPMRIRTLLVAVVIGAVMQTTVAVACALLAPDRSAPAPPTAGLPFADSVTVLPNAFYTVDHREGFGVKRTYASFGYANFGFGGGSPGGQYMAVAAGWPFRSLAGWAGPLGATHGAILIPSRYG